jgi:hypothetical protein
MSNIHVPDVDKAAALRKRVTIIEEFESRRLDEVPEKKERGTTFAAFVKRLMLICSIESIRRLF